MFCRSLHEMNPSDSSPSPPDATGPQLATMRQLSDADKLRKVICELLETERTYVKVGLYFLGPSCCVCSARLTAVFGCGAESIQPSFLESGFYSKC